MIDVAMINTPTNNLIGKYGSCASSVKNAAGSPAGPMVTVAPECASGTETSKQPKRVLIIHT